jgi:dihydrofolate reductase
MNSNSMISIIAAISEDCGIGKNNDLLWNIPEDLKRFKRLTLGKTVIMGRKTWESLPRKPLPGRKNVVITDVQGEAIPNAITSYSIIDALSKCADDEEVFIIGGGSIYRQFMPLAGRLYITHVHRSVPADIYFPEIDMNTWEIVEKDDSGANKKDSIPYTYIIYERKKGFD